MATKASIDITARITAALAEGTVPWVQPWIGGTRVAKNLSTKRPYRGLNVLLLALAPEPGEWWVTFKQAKKLGGTVRGGQHGTRLYFWNRWCFKHKCSADRCAHLNHEPDDRVLLQKAFTVFNAETQCDGLADKIPPRREMLSDNADGTRIAFRLMDALDRSGYTIPVDDMDGMAAYAPRDDRVFMPPVDSFISARRYYQTALHELAHSTGHQDRLNREDIVARSEQGYAREELTAELTSCLGMVELGAEPDLEQSAAYCKSWLRRLEDDPNLISVAAGRAAKALDMLFQGEEDT